MKGRFSPWDFSAGAKNHCNLVRAVGVMTFHKRLWPHRVGLETASNLISCTHPADSDKHEQLTNVPRGLRYLKFSQINIPYLWSCRLKRKYSFTRVFYLLSVHVQCAASCVGKEITSSEIAGPQNDFSFHSTTKLYAGLLYKLMTHVLRDFCYFDSTHVSLTKMLEMSLCMCLKLKAKWTLDQGKCNCHMFLWACHLSMLSVGKII